MDATVALGLVLPGLATGVGGLFLFVLRRPTDAVLDVLAGFTAGVMMAATVFSLLVPALDLGSLAEVVAGLAAGAGFVLLLDLALPHVHARFSERGEAEGQRALLLLSAMTIHNIPEGLAVGVAFAAAGTELGLPVAVAIGVQNIPEGFASAAPALRMGASAAAAFALAVATGLVEPPMALLGWAAAESVSTVLPASLAFAAGAMIYVVVDELIPESHARGYEREATLAFLGGFLVMLVLDNALG